MEVTANGSHQATETFLNILKETRDPEEKVGHPEENNLPLESDFYCKLCAVDCVNSTGKLLHSLDANHIEAYLTSLKKTPKRNPSIQAESDIKSSGNKVTSTSTTIEFEPGGQHSVCSTPISNTLIGDQWKENSKSKPKNGRGVAKEIGLNDSEFTSLHQSSAPTCIIGSAVSETESDCKNATFQQTKENVLSNFTKDTSSFHPKDGNNSEEKVLSDRLNDTCPCSSKVSQVVEPSKAISVKSKVNKEVSDVDFIEGKFKSFHTSHRLQEEIISAANIINEDVDSKFIWKISDKDCCRRIIVEGISAGTDKNIIIRHFSKYGLIKSHSFLGATLHIEYLEWQSVEKIFAEQTQEKTTVDGKEIQVKKNRRKRKKGLHIEKLPESVCTLFSSEENLSNGLNEFLASYQLNHAELYKQQVACKSVVSSLKFFAPRVYPYGSRITRLASKNSDLDIFVYITKPYHYFHTKYLSLTQELIIHSAARDIMRSSDFSNVVKLPKASVPIISCRHVPTGLKCDLTFRYPYQVYNTGLTLIYMSLDHRVRPLMLLIRYWASAHGLVGKGKFSSYSLNLICIFYLQQIPNKPVLPSVSLLMKLAKDHERATYGCWDCGYCENISLIPKSKNNSSLFHHVRGFFKFFAEFDTNNLVVCPFLGKPVHKNIFHPGMEHLLPIEFEKYKSNCFTNLTEPFKVDHVLCIQDPFVHNSNVAKNNRKDIVERFQIYCRLYTLENDYDVKLGASLAIAKTVSDGKFSESKHN